MTRATPFAVGFALLAAGSAAGQDDPPRSFAETVDAYFIRWDADRDGKLSPAEVSAAVLDKRYPAEAAVAAAMLKQVSGDPDFKAPPFTRDGLRSLDGKLQAANKPGADAMFASGLDRLANKDAALFGSGRPRLETIQQGQAGNCFCLAPLGALVARDPLGVARMFQPAAGGGCRVAFAGGKAVTVPPLTDAELILAGWNGGDGQWVNVYEKAVAEVLNLDKAGKPKAAVSLDATARGGPAAAVMELLTGHKVRGVWLQQPPGKPDPPVKLATQAELKKLFRDEVGKWLVCAGTAEKAAVPGIAPAHAYAVIGYDDRRAAVTLWNPHGQAFVPTGPAGVKNGYPTENGTFTVPLDDFPKVFLGVLVETADPAGKK